MELTRVGRTEQMVFDAQERAFYDILAPVATLATLFLSIFPLWGIALGLALLGVHFLNLALSALFVAYFYLVSSATYWAILRKYRNPELQLFASLLATIDNLASLRKCQVLSFSPSSYGKAQVVKERRELRKALRSQAKLTANQSAKLTGLSPEDDDYFKCARIGLWILHASKNFQDLDAIDNALRACGTYLQHLLYNKPWELADIAAPPGDVDDLPSKNVLRVARQMRIAIEAGLITAILGAAAAAFAFAAKVF
ncbi:hypothetical protein [Amycolatopsis vastitatis]|uniref:hypothetical protein n=1 Tax=Amycolatopsis vastitatis TaxID=1905142 RepID=UPI001177D835|nr:hypothetical protein [Amycolatopsis vastitatis]